jgi:hypothetical protein
MSALARGGRDLRTRISAALDILVNNAGDQDIAAISG